MVLGIGILFGFGVFLILDWMGRALTPLVKRLLG